MITIYQKPSFKCIYKKLHSNQRKSVNKAIQVILERPETGEEKKGDLSGIFVYKFDCVNQQFLLAYEWDEFSRTLLLLGVHENFYRDLK